MVLGVGSVYGMVPDRFIASYTPEGCCDPLRYQGVGWANRVVKRDARVMETEVVAMVLVGGMPVPLDEVTNVPGKFSLDFRVSSL